MSERRYERLAALEGQLMGASAYALAAGDRSWRLATERRIDRVRAAMRACSPRPRSLTLTRAERLSNLAADLDWLASLHAHTGNWARVAVLDDRLSVVLDEGMRERASA